MSPSHHLEEKNKCYGNTAESFRKGFSEVVVSKMDTELSFKLEEKKAKSCWIEEEAYTSFRRGNTGFSCRNNMLSDVAEAHSRTLANL